MFNLWKTISKTGQLRREWYKLYNFIFYISFRRWTVILLIGFNKLNIYDEISRITNNRKHLQNIALSLKREIQGEKYRKPNDIISE